MIAAYKENLGLVNIDSQTPNQVVKGCTLEVDGIEYFPDAPTTRGVKHLRELTRDISLGYECYIVFVILMPKVLKVLPNTVIDPVFVKACNEAIKAGV